MLAKNIGMLSLCSKDEKKFLVILCISASQLEAKILNLHKQENRGVHKTDEYEDELLILRRGQAFDVTVSFNRDYNPETDVITVQFVTGNSVNLT